jgi:ectoine hydroxylase-related dioxygenase (phytanoyl-CoA dioxygenase family)
MVAARMPEAIDAGGFATARDVVSDGAAEEILAALADSPATGRTRRGGAADRGVYALRNLLAIPRVRELAGELRTLVLPVLGSGARVVRGIFFDKTPGANWKVAWHQDLSIAVNRRSDLPGYGPWSVKAGVVHVQPPRQVLERMLTIRLHLDECGDDNGPLKVVPGSHRDGVLPPGEVARRVQAGPVVACAAPRGGAVLMRPLLLHASSPARSPSHRRVVHLEYCDVTLPAPLQWS